MLAPQQVLNETFRSNSIEHMRIIAGSLRNRPLRAPKGGATRPTSSRLREALFNICQHSIQGARFLDLCAGSGAMGLEALSRGASHAVFIDNHREAIRCIKENVQSLGMEEQATILCGDLFDVLHKLRIKAGPTFQIIYVDPPYNTLLQSTRALTTYSQHILTVLDQSPLLAVGGELFVEEAQEVILPSESLTSLRLQSSRRVGHSTLYHYIKR